MIKAPPPPLLLTFDLLRSIGFADDEEGGLQLELRNGSVRAIEGINRYFVPSIIISGVLASDRAMVEIHGALPRNLPSREFGLAFLATIIDQADRNMLPDEPAWVSEGRHHRLLLPWVRERAEYEARPRCHVERNWAKLALKDLSSLLDAIPDDTRIAFGFDGRTLIIECTCKVIAVAAEGMAWSDRYVLSAADLRKLPKRLMNPSVEFGFWDRTFVIGNHRYSSGVAIPSEKARDGF
jgi:hypothetical protein